MYYLRDEGSAHFWSYGVSLTDYPIDAGGNHGGGGRSRGMTYMKFKVCKIALTSKWFSFFAQKIFCSRCRNWECLKNSALLKLREMSPDGDTE
jgi:hypothetical protein